MLVAVDDTDSKEGMCTTFLLTEIIRRSDLDVIGYPRLVRLNPAIKYKTRGNGALAVNLGRGSGKSRKIGSIEGKEIWSYAATESEPHPEELLSVSREVVEELAVLDEPDTNPGIVVSDKYLPENFYWRAVKEEVSIPEAEAFLVESKAKFAKLKNGRGIIGAAASLSWPSKMRTFETLVYRNSSGKNPLNSMKLEVANRADQIPGTFNNIDRKNGYAAIFPKERTPVMLGIRGIDERPILAEIDKILSEAHIQFDRLLCFESNQASDDHIIRQSDHFVERQSYSIEGFLTSKPEVITGSHYFAYMRSHARALKIAAFEPTKEFRDIFGRLIPGDMIRVFGSYINETLNIEKMEIIALSCRYMRGPPICDSCGGRMSNKGVGDYRCRKCNSRKSMPHYRIMERKLVPGKYDVPVIARRHLSRPFELEARLGISNPGGSS